MISKRQPRAMSNDVNERRQHVLTLLASGLILPYEAAQLAGVTRQRIHQWVRRGGVEPAPARRRYLKALMHGNHT
jgi:hypothetical protein